MSDRNPSPAGGPLVEGPRDPEHDATASYALEPEYAESLTRKVLATTSRTVEVGGRGETAIGFLGSQTVAVKVLTCWYDCSR